jgi:hypothetical protein
MGIEPMSEVWEKSRATSPRIKTGNDTALAARCLAGHQPLSNEFNRQASYLAGSCFRCRESCCSVPAVSQKSHHAQFLVPLAGKVTHCSHFRSFMCSANRLMFALRNFRQD